MNEIGINVNCSPIVIEVYLLRDLTEYEYENNSLIAKDIQVPIDDSSDEEEFFINIDKDGVNMNYIFKTEDTRIINTSCKYLI